MKLSDFYYDLPSHLIAQHPLPQRVASKLLVLHRDSGQIEHRLFSDLPDYLNAGDVMIFNNSRVMPARLFGRKVTGGKVEILVERVLSEKQALVHVRANKPLKIGSSLEFSDGVQAIVEERKEDLFILKFTHSVVDVLQQQGHIPLPPYIHRADEQQDMERYQTVYAQSQGSVAAPTAGLHYDELLLEKLREKGVKTLFVTLHVGAGTFQSVRVEEIQTHKMHSEVIEVLPSVVSAIDEAMANQQRVLAVGTTSLRTLETAAFTGRLTPYRGETDIFIYPGFKFQCVNALQTNFHLPESTLMMLVSAFAGREKILMAYQEAIKNHYRFFSYGDTMLIL